MKCALVVAALVLPGCSSTTTTEGTSLADWPAGKGGHALGAVISAYAFSGFVDPRGSRTPTEIRLCHFHNPSNGGSFGAEDPFEDGAAKPHAVVIAAASPWCGPSRGLLRDVLPAKWDALRPKGLMILQVLYGFSVHEAATIADLEKWTTAFGSRFPSVIDPQLELLPTGCPELFVVDPRTMVITEIATGSPSETFWQKVEALLPH